MHVADIRHPVNATLLTASALLFKSTKKMCNKLVGNLRYLILVLTKTASALVLTLLPDVNKLNVH